MTIDEDENQPTPKDRTPIGDTVEPEPVRIEEQDPEQEQEIPYLAGEDPTGGAVPDGEETPENGGP